MFYGCSEPIKVHVFYAFGEPIKAHVVYACGEPIKAHVFVCMWRTYQQIKAHVLEEDVTREEIVRGSLF